MKLINRGGLVYVGGMFDDLANAINCAITPEMAHPSEPGQGLLPDSPGQKGLGPPTGLQASQSMGGPFAPAPAPAPHPSAPSAPAAPPPPSAPAPAPAPAALRPAAPPPSPPAAAPPGVTNAAASPIAGKGLLIASGAAFLAALLVGGVALADAVKGGKRR